MTLLHWRPNLRFAWEIRNLVQKVAPKVAPIDIALLASITVTSALSTLVLFLNHVIAVKDRGQIATLTL